MIRFARLFVFSFALLATAPLPAQRPAATPSPNGLPPAGELVARHVAASGGHEAIARIRSIHEKGTVEIPAMGITAESESFTLAPNRTVTRIMMPGIGEIAAGTDGPIGWSTNPMQGPRLLAGQELAMATEGADLQGNMLFPEALFSTLETQALTDFGGEPAYRVRMVRRDSGREALRYFSVASGLLIGAELTTVSEMGTVRTTLIYRDFRLFDGVLLPTRTETQAGAARMILTIREKTVNTVTEAAFILPASVVPLLRK